MGALVVMFAGFGIVILALWSIIVFVFHGVSFGIAIKEYFKELMEEADDELFENQNNVDIIQK